MTILNRVALRLKTVSKPIASGLNPKFQRSITGMAQRHRGETNMARSGYLDEKGGSWLRLRKCIFMITCLYFVNDYAKWRKRHKEPDTKLEALREAHQETKDQWFAQSRYRFSHDVFPWLVYPRAIAGLHPELCSLYIKNTRLSGKDYSKCMNLFFAKHCADAPE